MKKLKTNNNQTLEKSKKFVEVKSLLYASSNGEQTIDFVDSTLKVEDSFCLLNNSKKDNKIDLSLLENSNIKKQQINNFCIENKLQNRMFSGEKIEKLSKFLPKSAKKIKNRSFSYNKIVVLKNKTLSEWIEIIFAVSPFIEHMAEFVDGMLEKLACGSFVCSQKRGGIFNMFDEVIDVIERKRELVNLSVVAAKFMSLVSEKDLPIVETTLTKQRKISEIAENGLYKWVYVAKNKFLKRVTEACVVSGWNEEFFMEHFSEEPLIQYYV